MDMSEIREVRNIVQFDLNLIVACMLIANHKAMN